MLKWVIAVLALVAAPPLFAREPGEMLIIAHRGASGERPEHTLAAYERAIEAGADWIEPDLVATKDLVLVARHENELSDTTDVATREEFEDRNRTKEIDGQKIAGWFAEDFTLAELRTLRTKERLPNVRPANARYDGLYSVPTFAEIVTLVRAKEAESGRRIGIMTELKHPGFLLQEAGIDMVDLMVRALRDAGLDNADALVAVQSFEIAPLRRLDRMTDVKLVQLVKPGAGPADEPSMRYEDMISPTGLAEVAGYADMLGADLRLLLNDSGEPTLLTGIAQAMGLEVLAWTVRKENAFLPPQLRTGGGDAAEGNMTGLINLLGRAGVDGYFTDDPLKAVAVRRASR